MEMAELRATPVPVGSHDRSQGPPGQDPAGHNRDPMAELAPVAVAPVPAVATRTCPACTYSNHIDLRFCEICECELVPKGNSNNNPAAINGVPIEHHFGGNIGTIIKPEVGVARNNDRNFGVSSFGDRPDVSTDELVAKELDKALNVPKKESAPVRSSKCSVLTTDDGEVFVIDDDEDEANDSIQKDIDRIDKFESLASKSGTAGSGFGYLSGHVTETTPSFNSLALTNGIIELLSRILDKEDGVIEYRLCSPVPHITQSGFEGAKWTCGYRNLQMLAYSLNLHRPEYRAVLFKGNGDVPDVHGVQSWIERAWDDGFDRQVRSCRYIERAVVITGVLKHREEMNWEAACWGPTLGLGLAVSIMYIEFLQIMVSVVT
jgi:hypothetical protein